MLIRRIYMSVFLLLVTVCTASTSFASLGVREPEEEGYHLWGVSDPAEGFHHLWEEVMIDIFAIGIIFSLITIYLLIKYRRRYEGQEGSPPKLTKISRVGWVLIPVFIFMADDLFIAAEGWTLWNTYRTPPENSYEIELESAMWSWNFTYPDGVEAMNELRVPVGTPILLRMTSRDVVHSLFLPDFKVKEDSMPGRVTYMWFLPKDAGEYVMTCAEFCGVMHSMMHGKVIVMEENDFNTWMAEEKAKLGKGGA